MYSFQKSGNYKASPNQLAMCKLCIIMHDLGIIPFSSIPFIDDAQRPVKRVGTFLEIVFCDV